MTIRIPTPWQTLLSDTIKQPWYTALITDVEREYVHETIYPPQEQVFAALESCAPEAVKVVILGQDPYHGPGQAQGLAFSVPDSIQTPPSLRNIHKEITSDTGTPPRVTNNLTDWAQQGVLLLNTTLTVQANKPLSHSTFGWNRLTDRIIERIAITQTNVVFMLWGAHAQSKATLINSQTHCILTAAHPSPLSAYRGFFGCRHFSQANQYLIEHTRTPITW